MAGHARVRKDWECRTCVGRDGNPWRNHSHRTECKMCKVHKGKCHARDVPIPPPRARADQPGTAAGGQSQADLRKREADLRKREADLRKREAEVKKLQDEAQAGQDDSHVGEDADGDAAEDLDQVIEELSKQVKVLEALGMSEPEAQQLLEGKKQRLAEARERKRSGQPLHLRLRRIERAISTKESAVDKLKTDLIPNAERAMAEMQARLEKHRAKLEEEEKELRELQAKRDEERRLPAKGLEDIQTAEELEACAKESITKLLGTLEHPLCPGGPSSSVRLHALAVHSILMRGAAPPDAPSLPEAQGSDDDADMFDCDLPGPEMDNRMQLLLASVAEVDADTDDGDGGGAEAKRRRKHKALVDYARGFARTKIGKPKKQ